MSEPNSGDLLHRSTFGDAEARDELLRRHLPGVRAFVRLQMSALLRANESATDLVQSACRELFAKGDGFEYRGEAEFRAWLYTTVRNKVRTRERDLRAQKRDARRTQEIDAAGADLAVCYSQVLSPSQVLIAAERVRELEAVFEELPDHYREVIAMSRVAQLDHATIAAHMGRTEAAVRNLLHRALAVLAEALRRRRTATG